MSPMSARFVTFLLLLISPRVGMSVLIGPTGSPSLSTDHALDAGGPMWMVTPPGPLAHDDDAGPWLKSLFDASGTGAPMADDDPASPTPTVFVLAETIPVDVGSIPWTDWHEEIETPGWFFAPGKPTIMVTPPSSTSTFDITSSTTVDNMGDMLWLFFDDIIPPGSTLEIIKRLEYLGPDMIPETGDSHSVGPVVISQHASVPEPSAPALIFTAAGVVAVLRFANSIRGQIRQRLK